MKRLAIGGHKLGVTEPWHYFWMTSILSSFAVAIVVLIPLMILVSIVFF